jgi:hypothetical protein
MNRFTHLSPILLLAAAFAVAWHGVDSRRTAESSLAAIAGDQAALAARIRAAETNVANGEREQAELQAILNAGSASRSGSAAPTASAGKVPDEATVLAHNPELAALYAKSFRAGLAQRYGPSYQAFGLSPDQVERINDLITQGKLEEMKLLAAAGSQGLDRSAPEVQALLRQLRARYASAGGEIIGETADRQFDRLVGAFPLSDHVQYIAALLASGSAPLTNSQGAQLLQILGNASSLDPVTMRADPATVRWGEALQQAEGILSAPQLAAMKVDSQLSELMRLKNEFYRRQAAQN